MPKHYTSGDWLVTEGKEAAFTSGWQDFLEHARREFPSVVAARLVRDAGNPRHFVSWALWKDPESREAWQKSRVFEEDLTALRALCEDFHGGNYEIAVLIGEGDVEAP